MKKRQKKKRIRRLMAQAEALLRAADSSPLVIDTGWLDRPGNDKKYLHSIRYTLKFKPFIYPVVIP